MGSKAAPVPHPVAGAGGARRDHEQSDHCIAVERFLAALSTPVFWRVAGFSVLVLLAGCANGDFGRVKSSLVKDDMHAWVGKVAPGRHNKPPSQFPLTDAERQLRDLAYPLIEPPYDRQRWYSVLGEYGINGVSDMPYPDRTAYATRLLTTPVRSQNARYARLTEDIRNDVIRVDPFFAVARYVIDMDKKREQSLSRFAASNKDSKGRRARSHRRERRRHRLGAEIAARAGRILSVGAGEARGRGAVADGGGSRAFIDAHADAHCGSPQRVAPRGRRHPGFARSTQSAGLEIISIRSAIACGTARRRPCCAPSASIPVRAPARAG